MSQIAASAGSVAQSAAHSDDGGNTRQLIFRTTPATWSAESFAREQLHGLMQKLFFSGQDKSVRHVLFSATDPATHIDTIARLLGEALALEKAGSVAVVARVSHLIATPLKGDERMGQSTPLRQGAWRVKENLWLVPDTIEEGPSSTAKLYARICNLRREFDYSIVVGPMADSHEVLAMAAIADGIVLALSAGHTRRAAARNVMRFLDSANVRILGTVLTDRVFPMPANIYRRL